MQLFGNKIPVLSRVVGPSFRHMLEVQGLTKTYGDFAAVKDLSFTAGPGELLGLVGPNGAGKTTTLRCLAGIFPPTRGTIRIAGRDLLSDPIGAKRELAFFSDEPRLFDHLTVRQHLMFTARLYQVVDAEAQIPGLLSQLELVEKADLLPGELSRGMKQKVQLACGLLHRPQVLFFDEPLTGLDPFAIRLTKDLIRNLAAEGRTIVLSSHLLHLLEEICTRVLVLQRGIKVVHGTLEEIRAQFAGGSADASLEDLFLSIAGQARPAVDEASNASLLGPPRLPPSQP